MFSFMWIWFVSWRADSRSTSPAGGSGDVYYKTQYPELFNTPVFWLTVFVLVALMIVPFFIWYKWRQFFGGDPMYDIRAQSSRKEKAAVIEVADPMGTGKDSRVFELVEISEENVGDQDPKKAI